MKISPLLYISVALLFSPSLLASEIEFNISGVKDDNTKLYVQLFKGEENYTNSKPEMATITKAKNGKASIIFSNLNEGEYALRFYHDQNDNGTLETNLFGMPVEGYGFSNNAVPNYGPLSFSDIKFVVNKSDDKVINESTVIY